MSMFAALKSDDSEENYIEELPSLEKLTPQYTIQQILNLYKDSPKDPNLIGESYQQKKFEKLFVKGAQPPECFSFKPPSSEINSPIFLGSSSGKNFQRQNQQQQKKQQKGQQKGQQNSNQNQRKQQNSQPLSITINTRQQKEPPIQDAHKELSHNENTSIKQKKILIQPQYIQHVEKLKVREYNPTEGIMWFYKDPVDNILGPFSSAKMKEWLDCRYIDKTLLIRQANLEGKFQSIAATFPDISKAFSDDFAVSPQPTQTTRKETNSLFSFDLTEDEEATLSQQMKIK